MNIGKRSLDPGTCIHNRYRIEQVLGEGGFGVTYRVTDLKHNLVAAMKEYMPADIAYRRPGSVEVLSRPEHQTSFERFRDKFLEEAQIIYRYRGHPNIIDVRHLFYENNTAYYVMEFISGMDLAKLLAKNGQRLEWSQLKPIIAQVSEALHEVHGSGMIHCDIKPDNIFILNGGQVKLIDFGAAKSTIPGQSSMMMLTRGYAPPEQLTAHGRVGPWTDIYALAVTVYRAYTGRMPPTAEDRLNAARTVWPSEMGIPAPSHQWEQVLKKGMALRVDDRFQSAREFWQELSAAAPARSEGLSRSLWDNGFSGAPDGIPHLECLQGIFRGKRIPIHGELLVGTDATRCQLTFPPGSPGISRMHMSVLRDGNEVLVVDSGSTYGTWLNNEKLTPGLVYELQPGQQLYLGDGQIFCLRSG